MQATLKKILYIALFILMLFASALITGVVFFEDEIKNKVLENIKESVTTSFHFSKSKLDLKNNFPSAAVKIDDLFIASTNNDTLIYAESIFVDLNLLDIINTNVKIKNITVLNAVSNLQIGKEKNYQVIRKTKGSKSIDIQKIIVKKSKINFIDQKQNLNINSTIQNCIGLIKKNSLDIILFGNIASLRLSEKEYVKNREIKIDSELVFGKNHKVLRPSNIVLDKLSMNVNGVLSNDSTDLTIDLLSQNLKYLTANIPNYQKKYLEDIDIRGNADVKINLHIDKKNSKTHLKSTYEVHGGKLFFHDQKTWLQNINIKGFIESVDSLSFKKFILTAKEASASINKKSKINGSFIISDLNRPTLNAQLNYNLNLAEVNKNLKNSPFNFIKGDLQGSTIYKRSLSNKFSVTQLIKNGKHHIKNKKKDIVFRYQGFKKDFIIESIDADYKNDKFDIKKSKLLVGDTDIDFKGEVKNFIKFIFEENINFNLNGDTRSTYINFNELFNIKSDDKPIKKDKEEVFLPKWINARINYKVGNFIYEDLLCKEAAGKINYSKGLLNINDIEMESLNGVLKGSVKLVEFPAKHLHLSANADFKNLNIRNGFSSFRNFNQTFIKDEHLKGLANGAIKLNAYWDSNFKFNYKKFDLHSHIIIEKGELIQFKPLEKMSAYINIEDLKDVKFSTLENTINIKNEIITIPIMEIKSTALSLFVSGTHTFDKKIDYSIRLLLSELLSSKFRKRNTNITNKLIGSKNKNELWNTIYLKMTGDTDDPKISFDKIKIGENIKNNIKKEKEIIKNIIKEDLLNQKKKSDDIKKEENNLIIEWDDE